MIGIAGTRGKQRTVKHIPAKMGKMKTARDDRESVRFVAGAQGMAFAFTTHEDGGGVAGGGGLAAVRAAFLLSRAVC